MSLRLKGLLPGVLPVSAWFPGEHSELALIRRSALGHVQHLAMA